MTVLDSKAGRTGGQLEGGSGAPRRRRLGEALVESGLVDEQMLHECIGIQATQSSSVRQRIGEILVERGIVSERDIAVSLGRVLDLPMVDLANSLVSPAAARLLPRAVAERYLVLAIDAADDHLTLAMSDPTDVVALDDVRVYTRMRSIRIVVATESAIRNHITRVWSLGEGAADVAAFEEFDALPEVEAEDVSTVDDAPVVRLVSEILTDAARALASDVHLEPEREGLRIRYRVDGLLRDVMVVPRAAMNALTSRVKIISGLDIAERRRPQDGRTRINVDGQFVDARVSTLPTMHGEKVVVRLLSRNEGVVPLARIGLSAQHLDIFVQTVVAPQGLILITGPTGSGKTSTLYSAVCQLRTPDRNLVTLEDPVEMALPGINQVQVHERAGVTFAAGLRSILRQDPDVILVGEVRDTETADLALRASLTGHLVFTTLHTNDAASAITRLVDMGVEPFLIASSLALVVAQRLVRVPCKDCSARYSPSPSTLDVLGLREEDLVGHNVRRGAGCDHCGHTGYLGRTAIFEVMPVDGRMRSVLTATPTETAIRAIARASGSLSLRADGIAKALRGETTLEEVIRVTQVDAVAVSRCGGCRRVFDDGMTYCPYCARVVDSLSCGSCSARLESDWRHCPWCRAATESAEPGQEARSAHAGRPAAAAAEVPAADVPAIEAAVEAATEDVEPTAETAGPAELKGLERADLAEPAETGTPETDPTEQGPVDTAEAAVASQVTRQAKGKVVRSSRRAKPAKLAEQTGAGPAEVTDLPEVAEVAEIVAADVVEIVAADVVEIVAADIDEVAETADVTAAEALEAAMAKLTEMTEAAQPEAAEPEAAEAQAAEAQPVEAQVVETHVTETHVTETTDGPSRPTEPLPEAEPAALHEPALDAVVDPVRDAVEALGPMPIEAIARRAISRKAVADLVSNEARDVLAAMEADIAEPVAPEPAPAAVRALPRIVVLDSDKLMCALVTVALSGVAEVLPARTAEKALRMCGAGGIDALILELQLPDLNAVEVVRLLRGDSRTNLLPLMLVTGSKNAAMLEEARHAGVDDVLTKPIDPAELVERVRALLAKASVSQ